MDGSEDADREKCNPILQITADTDYELRINPGAQYDLQKIAATYTDTKNLHHFKINNNENCIKYYSDPQHTVCVCMR